MKKYQLYLFDFDGTLIDSDPMIEASFKELYSKYKPREIIDKNKLLTFSGPPIKETLLKEFPDANQIDVLNDFLMYSIKYYGTLVKAYPHSRELLLFLKSRGYKVGLLTSKAKKATMYALKVTNLDGLFDAIMTSDDVKETKPSPEGVYSIMKQLNITNRDDVIMIGDSNFDYLTSVNAGIDFGYVNFSPRKLKENAKVDIFINSFNDFIKEIKNGKA